MKYLKINATDKMNKNCQMYFIALTLLKVTEPQRNKS